MNIDTKHLHFWMNAIRISNNPMRTLDAFWSGQVKSKEWLVDTLEYIIRPNINKEPLSVDIHGGWVGVLASMLFQSNLHIEKIVNIDIDPTVQHVAIEMNRMEYNQERFKAITMNMVDYNSVSNIVVNTSCEHIKQTEYDSWLSRMSSEQLLVLQSNNYDIPEHVRIANSLNDFVEQSKLRTIIYKGLLQLPLYDRYMVIGRV